MRTATISDAGFTSARNRRPRTERIAIGLSATAGTKDNEPFFSDSESLTIAKARSLSETELASLRQKDELTIEESQMLLLRMIDEEYDRP